LGQTITWQLDSANQVLNFQWRATLLGLATVTVTAPQASTWTTNSWLVTNNWTQNALYSVSPGYALSGTNACGGQCITVANTASPANKQAVVLMTGRALALAGQGTRPLPAPVAASQLLENANRTAGPGNLVLEANARTATFNDYPIVVRP
jgi:hypothetical protein